MDEDKYDDPDAFFSESQYKFISGTIGIILVIFMTVYSM